VALARRFPDDIATALKSGVMQPMAADLSDEDIHSIATYLGSDGMTEQAGDPPACGPAGKFSMSGPGWNGWSIDARNDTMGGMIQYMQEHLHNMLMPADIDFELTHAGLAEQEKLAMNFRQNVYLTFKEAINNVVKHSGATRVLVGLKKENGLFSMHIKDDGKGIDHGKTTSGQGLYNMRLRAGRLKASLQIESEQGVTVILKVPV